MKKTFPAALFIMSIFYASFAKAQCDFTPVITPHNPILCPNTQDTLFTTEKYDTYQWFKNGKKIEGATNAFYIIDQYKDAPGFFKVETTRNGCRDTSRRILVDGYVFAPPIVISTGDPGVYDIRRDATIYCPHDTLILTFGMPYTENIQWYDSYKPIPGANAQSHIVTSGGSFTVCGSPKICPDFTECQNLPVNAIFENPQVSITQKNDTLFASKAARYRWFLSGNPIPGADKSYYIPTRSGKYLVAARDKYNCDAVSAPYKYEDTAKGRIEDLISFAPNPVRDVIRVRLKSPEVKRLVIADIFGNRYIDISALQPLQTIPMQQLHAGSYLLQAFNAKQQLIGTAQLFKQ